jgi:hypothetical protein
MWSWLGLPPVGHETALHIDLATALIALLALIFSIWTWRHQTRMSIEAMRMERDNGLIHWIDSVIETIVEIEFLLRDKVASGDQAQLLGKRDAYLASLAAAVDKGRLYFPRFTRDVALFDAEPSLPKVGPPILDGLVGIYDLVKGIDLRDAGAIKLARPELMKAKRLFIIEAQNEVEPNRRLLPKKRGRASRNPNSGPD